MRVLLDTNILLDLFLEREPFVEDAAAILAQHQQGVFDGYVSAITPVNLFYITRKMKGVAGAKRLVAEVLTTFEVCPVTSAVLRAAVAHPMPDYEDAVQYLSATLLGLDAIVTRNTQDYQAVTIPVYDPPRFRTLLRTSSLDDTDQASTR
ncbi:MAG: PIN domain-containing protein [Chloroflexota bacterium]|nr:PIN domain-containing protein [Chloroflexota bacterium]